MSDLISRGKLIQAVVKNPDMSASDLYSLIVDAPVVFDVEGVVKQMEDYSIYLDDDNGADVVAEDLINIVEGAWKNE